MLDDILQRARAPLTASTFAKASRPFEYGARTYPYSIWIPRSVKLITEAKTGYAIPAELSWLEATLWELISYQRALGLPNRRVDITVRHGGRDSHSSGSWHVDGLKGGADPPMQVYIWSNRYPTEYAEQGFQLEKFPDIPINVFKGIRNAVRPECIRRCQPDRIYMIDTYVVHRCPEIPASAQRLFWRIGFLHEDA